MQADVAYIGNNTRTWRHRKTKIGTEVAHATRDWDTSFKVKRSKVKVTRALYSPPCWRVRQLQRWAWQRGGREKLLLRCRLLGRARHFGAHGGGEGRGISWRPPAYSLSSKSLMQIFTSGVYRIVQYGVERGSTKGARMPGCLPSIPD